MPTFQYQLRDRSGKITKGQIEAVHAREAAAKIRVEGSYIVNLQPVSAARRSLGAAKAQQRPVGRVKLKDLLLFTRQFAVMVRAGVNLVNCLNLLAEQTENRYLGYVIGDIRRQVESGEALHAALGKHPKVFPPIYIHMVEAGEVGGQLETVLIRLTEHIERDFTLQKKVIGALTYPAIIACVAVLVVLLLLTVVMPTFIGMFVNSGVKLPWITQLLINFSNFLNQYWYVVFSILGGTAFGLFKYKGTPGGKRKFDYLLFSAPVVGPVIQKLGVARFTRTLATLLDSGVAIITSMEVVERAVGNAVITDAIASARANLTRGTSLAAPLAEMKIFPKLVTQMIAVGEETGELSDMLNQVAEFYEREANYAVEALTAMIEPMVIVFMGVVVGGIVAAVMMPMFEMSTGATLR